MPELNWPALLPPLLAAGATVATLAAMAGQLRRARLIEDTPTSRIRSAAQGYVELNGFVRAADPAGLTAPLTGKPCLWYRYTIERLESSRSGRHWRRVESGSSDQPLLFDDHTGQCLIDPRRAEVTVERRERWTGNRRHPRGTDGQLWQRLLSSGRFRYTEWRIEADDWLYVLGWFATPRQPSFIEQKTQRQRELLQQWKQDQSALIARFDQDGDGQIDLAEWEEARTQARRQAQREIIAAAVTEPLPVISCGNRQRPFLLTTRDPHQLARHYRWRAFGALAAGLCVSILLTARMLGLWQ
ncbi:MAG: GIDE domain-containing protein [Spongiibacteraceae bacterium]|jgi:hypothetical protein|nr:GIDE domain-containing protein [Spongiibacteraceae bacterium]